MRKKTPQLISLNNYHSKIGKAVYFTLLTGVLLLSSNAYAQDTMLVHRLDSFGREELGNRFNGCITVCKNGTLLFDRAYGFASMHDRASGAVYMNVDSVTRRTTVETKYRVGSSTIFFTSVMVFQLVEEGKVFLHTKLSTYFPTIPNAANITISDLLSQRSGIHSLLNDSVFERWMGTTQTEEQMIKRIAISKPDFNPNDTSHYSDANYLLLGYIIEHVTGKSYQDNLKERIADKVGLKDTYCGGKIDLHNNESYSYAPMWEYYHKDFETDLSVVGGSGAIVSTTKDLCQFIAALFHGKLISKSSLDSMEVRADDCGRGMFRVGFYDRTSYGVAGGIDGFGSLVFYFPIDSISLAICSNGGYTSIDNIRVDVLRVLFNKPDPPLFIDLPVDLLKTYEGVYSSMIDSSLSLTMVISIKVNNGKLTYRNLSDSLGSNNMQELPLGAISPTEFKETTYDYDLDIVFDAAKKEMLYTDRGEQYRFMRIK